MEVERRPTKVHHLRQKRFNQLSITGKQNANDKRNYFLKDLSDRSLEYGIRFSGTIYRKGKDRYRWESILVWQLDVEAR